MQKAVNGGTTVHVIFTQEGIAGWFGPEPVAGSEPVDIEELRPLLPEGTPQEALAAGWRNLLIRHCRVDGVWVPRPAAPIAEPSSVDPEPGESGETEADA